MSLSTRCYEGRSPSSPPRPYLSTRHDKGLALAFRHDKTRGLAPPWILSTQCNEGGGGFPLRPCLSTRRNEDVGPNEKQGVERGWACKVTPTFVESNTRRGGESLRRFLSAWQNKGGFSCLACSKRETEDLMLTAAMHSKSTPDVLNDRQMTF